jgi:hypothetical protein
MRILKELGCKMKMNNKRNWRQKISGGLTGLLLAGTLNLPHGCATSQGSIKENNIPKKTEYKMKDLNVNIKKEKFRKLLENSLGIEINNFTIKQINFDENRPSYFVTLDDYTQDFLDVENIPHARYMQSQGTTFYFPQVIENSVKNLWMINNSELSNFLLPEQKLSYGLLVQKEFKEDSQKEKEFISSQMNINNRKSFIRNSVIEHERFHERDSQDTDMEERAFIYGLIVPGREYLELGLMVGSEYDLQSGVYTENNIAGTNIKRFYDKILEDNNIPKGHYDKLSRNEIRDIARYYAQKRFPNDVLFAS